MRPPSARLLVLATALLASAAARADTVWLCGLSADATRIVCIADDDPLAAPAAAAGQTALVRGTAFPLDPRRRWTVDLWSVPTDLAFVEQLAKATICYRSPGCSVVFAGPPQRS